MKFENFTKEDWMGFNGAEFFVDGTDPCSLELISDKKYESLTIIIDGNGINFYYSDTNDKDYSYTLNIEECPKDVMMHLVWLLNNNTLTVESIVNRLENDYHFLSFPA